MSQTRGHPHAFPSTITVTIPLRFERRGGRRSVIAPAESQESLSPKYDNAMIKALARAHRWRRKLENGEFPSITELSTAEGVNQSYACRVLRLTLLAPTIVELILDGRQPKALQLSTICALLPVDWRQQTSILVLKGKGALHRNGSLRVGSSTDHP